MSYERIQKEVLPLDVGASADMIAPGGTAAAQLTWIPAMKCKVYGWGVHYVVAVTANGFNTTLPVLSLGYDKAGATAEVEKSTITVPLAGKAVGTEQVAYVTPFFCDGPSGDALVFNIKTQGTGATTTGECRPYVLVEWFPACTGS